MDTFKKIIYWLLNSYLLRSIVPYEIRRIFYVAEDIADLNRIRKERNEEKLPNYDDMSLDDDDETGVPVEPDELKRILIADSTVTIGQLVEASLIPTKLSPEEAQKWAQDEAFQNEKLSALGLNRAEYTKALQICTSNPQLAEIYSALMGNQPYKKDISTLAKK